MKILIGITARLAATGASAAVACNDEGDCWHVKGEIKYKPDLKVHVHPDDRKFVDKNRRWHLHEGHGYWRSGIWGSRCARSGFARRRTHVY